MARKLPSANRGNQQLQGMEYLKEYIKESFDPRNKLFSGGGLGSAIGRAVFGKGYSMGDKYRGSGVSSRISSSPSVDTTFSEDSAANAALTAKNTMVLPNMARDMNIMRLNVQKLVKLQGGKATNRPDMFWKQAGGREAEYESALAKMKSSVMGKGSLTEGLIVNGKKVSKKNPVPITIVNEMELLGEIGIMEMLLGKGGAKGGAGAMSGIASLVGSIISSPVVVAAIGAAGLFALYARATKNVSSEDIEKLNKDVADSASSYSGEAKTIMDVHEQTSDIERRKMNLLANRSGDDKSLMFWKDSQLQQDYLKKVGFDEKTGLTSAERDAGFTGIDEKGNPVKRSTSPTPSSSAPSTSPTASSFEKMAMDLIKKEEGLPKNGKAYKDANGVSIGYGHFITGQEQSQGFIQSGNEKIPLAPNLLDTQITKEQAESLLLSDLPKYITAAQGPLGEAWDKLNDQQKATMVSYAYNTGSTKSLVRAGIKDAIMSGDMNLASKIIEEKGIKTSQGQYHSGLAKRRGAEAQLFAGSPSTGDNVNKASQQVQVAQRQETSGGNTTNNNTVNNNTRQMASNGGPKPMPASPYNEEQFFESVFNSVA